MLAGIIKIQPEKLGRIRFGKLLDPRARVIGPQGTHMNCRRYEVLCDNFPMDDFTLLISTNKPQVKLDYGTEIKILGSHVVAIPSGQPIGDRGVDSYYDCFVEGIEKKEVA